MLLAFYDVNFDASEGEDVVGELDDSELFYEDFLNPSLKKPLLETEDTGDFFESWILPTMSLSFSLTSSFIYCMFPPMLSGLVESLFVIWFLWTVFLEFESVWLELMLLLVMLLVKRLLPEESNSIIVDLLFLFSSGSRENIGFGKVGLSILEGSTILLLNIL